MIIALIVLSSILLILVLGLIFNKEFRNDVIKPGSENEAELKGIKIKGALFWVIYALTAIGTIYLAIQYQQTAIQPCDPVLSANGSDHWIALDINEEKPVKLNYGCENKTKVEDHSQRVINMDLKLNNEFEVLGTSSDYRIGTMNMKSLKDLRLTNDWDIEKYIEIYYEMQLQPFASSKKNSDFYDWNEYENLPFTISVKFSQERQVHILIESKDDPPKFQDKYLSMDKWDEYIPINDQHFIIRLRSRDLDASNNIEEHVNFQIIKFSGNIELIES